MFVIPTLLLSSFLLSLSLWQGLPSYHPQAQAGMMSKRTKTPTSLNVSCLVDGCNANLGECREYHRRHKVCELHSKTPKVTIGGREQRFCQQCSRFHSLVEFDEGKRSCRKRLDGHNRRRRKPQSDTLSRTTATFFSHQQGLARNRIMSFNAPQIHLNAVMDSAVGPFNNQPPLNYLARHHLNLDSSQPPPSHFNFFQHRSPPLANHSRALSLLSSSPPAHPTPTTMPTGISQYGFVHEMHNQALISGSSGATLQFHGMFHDDEGDSSSKQQKVSFRWD